MREVIRTAAAMLFISGISWMSCSAISPSQGRELSAGTARVNITPAVPIPMSGYRSRTKPFEGIHDSIYARAIVFSNGESKAAIVSAEVIGFSTSFCEETSRLMEQSTNIKAENILLDDFGG